MTNTRYRTGIPRVPECEDPQCNLIAGHLGEHEQRKMKPLSERLSMSVTVKLDTAVAAELLKTLKALREHVDEDFSGYWTETTSNLMQMADAAIAKAEGR